MTQPEALRLAVALELRGFLGTTAHDAAAELRRLHQFAEDQIGRATAAKAALQMTKTTHALKIAAVEAQRDALLKTMKWLDNWMGAKPMTECSEKVRAAIKAAEGEAK